MRNTVHLAGDIEMHLQRSHNETLCGQTGTLINITDEESRRTQMFCQRCGRLALNLKKNEFHYGYRNALGDIRNAMEGRTKEELKALLEDWFRDLNINFEYPEQE